MVPGGRNQNLTLTVIKVSRFYLSIAKSKSDSPKYVPSKI